MEWMKGQYETDLGDVTYLTRDLMERTKDMDRINIRDRETSSDLEDIILYLLEA